jgi:hypothetical protein
MDIRLPVGAIFTIYGLLLTVYGLMSGDVEARHMLMGLQVNIVAGIGMLIFGGSFLYLARKGTPTVRRSSASPEGRAIENRERRTGLEGH